jgi:hypothetical protein
VLAGQAAALREFVGTKLAYRSDDMRKEQQPIRGETL